MSKYFLSVFFCFLTSVACASDFSWPVENQQVRTHKDILEYIQPTQSGQQFSGTFGLVRNNQTRFHGGIDIKSTHHDSTGEPADNVLAFYSGIVSYINNQSKNSSYGKYVILEHIKNGITFYTLYAHLGQINESIELNSRVSTGQKIAKIGRTSNATNINKQLAHLHFEICLKLSNTETFQQWYSKKFPDDEPNLHGEWNGMNFIKLDPIDFIQKNSYNNCDIKDYFKSLQSDFSILVKTSNFPTFIKTNKNFIKNPEKLKTKQEKLTGWIVNFTWFGFPISFEPVFRTLDLPKNHTILTYNKNKKHELEKMKLISFTSKGFMTDTFLKKELAFFFNFEM